MPYEEIIGVVIFLVFVIFSIVRKIQEQMTASRRQDEQRNITLEELPEETRRMLFGETAPPTARPRGRDDSMDEEDEDVIVARPRRVEPRMAKPRPGSPRPPAQTVPAAQPVQRQPARQTPFPPPRPQAQPPFRAPATQKPPPPPRQTPATEIPRMRPAPLEGQMQRQIPPHVPRAPQRRRQPTVPPALVEPQEGPQQPFRPSSSEPQRGPSEPRRRRMWFAGTRDLRRAIVLTEILGPPKSLRNPRETGGVPLG